MTWRWKKAGNRLLRARLGNAFVCLQARIEWQGAVAQPPFSAARSSQLQRASSLADPLSTPLGDSIPARAWPY